MGYSPWGGKESDTTEQLHLAVIISVCILAADSGISDFFFFPN